MEEWKLVLISASTGGTVGVVLSYVFRAIGWYFKKQEEMHRDAGDVAKLIFNEVKEEEDEEAKEKMGELVSRFGDAFRRLKEEWKK